MKWSASAFTLSLLFHGIAAISFELLAFPESTNHAGKSVDNFRCFSVYIGKDVLTVGKYSVQRGPHQRVSIEVTDMDQSVLYTKSDASGQNEKFAFTTHGYSDYMTCFRNILDPGVYANPSIKATIQFDLQMGAEAKDSSATTQENLKPIEVELRVLEQVMDGIVDEMEYLKQREAKMRDTNESTNERVQYLSMLSIATLLLSGAWQVLYLKRFFETKKIL